MFIRSLALVGATLFLLSGVALAKPKVVLLAFTGDPKEEARRVVAAVLADDVKIAKRKDVRRALDKLELDPEDLTVKGMKTLAAELEVDAVIQGSLSKKEPNRVLHFQLVVHGKKVPGFTIEFGSLKSSNFKDKLREKLLAKLAGRDNKKSEEETGADKTDAESLVPMAGKSKKAGNGSADKDKATGTEEGEDGKGVKRGAGEAAEEEGSTKSDKDKKRGEDRDAETKSDEEKPAVPRSANRAAIRVDLGASAHKRSLSFSSRSFAEAPKNYSNSIVPGVRVEVQAYPLALSNSDSILAGLGLGGFFDQTLLLKVPAEGAGGIKVPVTERRFAIGPRFRYFFGSKPTSPSVTAVINYGRRSFVLDRSKLTTDNTLDVPDVEYTGGDLGVEARIPLGQRLAAVVGGSVVLLTSAGPIEKADQYGQAKVTAGQAMAGLDIAITGRFAVRLIAEFAQYGFTFKGTGMLSNARDGDPSTPDVGGATDRYLSGAATFAIHY